MAPSTKEARYPTVTRSTRNTRHDQTDNAGEPPSQHAHHHDFKKKRVVLLTSRGVTASNVELVKDLLKLMPHAQKEHKFDKREPLRSLNEIANLANAPYALYFEARKMKDLYLWASAVDKGPCAKFLVQQIKPMGDLRLTGNCLLGSRPILSFDPAFDASAHSRVLRALLSTIFATPKGHPRSKPFHDHVLNFSFLGGRVILRHYQVLQPDSSKGAQAESLVEIGPRLSLMPIRVFAESFGGGTLYANGDYVSPNEVRAAAKRKAGKTTRGHVAQKEKRRRRLNEEGVADLPEDPLDDVFDP